MFKVKLKKNKTTLLIKILLAMLVLCKKKKTNKTQLIKLHVIYIYKAQQLCQ